MQKRIQLRSRPRGFHLVTDEIVRELPELRHIKIGLAHFFIQHTSASLTINENADPDVRRDLETHMRHLVPDAAAHFVHTTEGPDDMAAHVKSTLCGAGVSIPIGQGRLLLGTWQGIYLGEHRIDGGPRTLIVTLNGETSD